MDRSQTTFLAVSQATKAYACDHMVWPSARVRVIHNGIDADHFQSNGRPAPGGSLVVGTAARLTHVKGIDTVLGAIGLLRKRGIPVELRIAGTGSLLESLRQLARDLGIEQWVHFLGLVQDMPGFYAGLDAFVLGSRSEGLPLTVLEAMSMELPVVATAVMGVPEVLRDGKEGFLVPAGDVESLALAISRLSGEPRMRHTMGRNGRRQVLVGFTREAMSRGIAEVYEDLRLAQRGGLSAVRSASTNESG